MADIIYDGKMRIAFVPTIANIASPDVSSELSAATELTCTMTMDGLIGFEPDTAKVDNSSMCSTFDTGVAGRASWSNTALRLKKQAAVGDTIYDLLVRDLAGYIVVRRDLLYTVAWTAAQAVEVYPIVCGEVKNLPPEGNTVHKYEVPVIISLAPNMRAVLQA